MAEIISGIYKITNTITNDFYIGSSKNIKNRWAAHKHPSRWKNNPNNPMYLDFQKYGINKFEFQILEEVEVEQLKEKEQQFIETLKPTYNNRRADGWDFKRYKESQNKYNKSNKGKETLKKAQNKYNNQQCLYNGEVLTLNALYLRFYRAGIEHSAIEAKKYLVL